jgi:hypothetical protein
MQTLRRSFVDFVTNKSDEKKAAEAVQKLDEEILTRETGVFLAKTGYDDLVPESAKITTLENGQVQCKVKFGVEFQPFKNGLQNAGDYAIERADKLNHFMQNPKVASAFNSGGVNYKWGDETGEVSFNAASRDELEAALQKVGNSLDVRKTQTPAPATPRVEMN